MKRQNSSHLNHSLKSEIVQCRVSSESRQIIKHHATAQKESISVFLRRAIEETMARDNEKAAQMAKNSLNVSVNTLLETKAPEREEGALRILAFSNLHNIVTPSALTRVIKHELPVDLAICLGDTALPELIHLKMCVRPTPIWGIRGNHDGEFLFSTAHVVDLHGRSMVVNGFRLAGFQGSIRDRSGHFAMYTHQESHIISEQLPSADILVSHDTIMQEPTATNAPAFHAGLYGLNEYLERVSPMLHLCGHMHENKQFRYQNTTVLSVYGVSIITIQNRKLENVKVLFDPQYGLKTAEAKEAT